MAKAKIKNPKPKPVVVLRLTMAEATVLHLVVRNVGGSPTYSPRREIQSISNAMDAALDRNSSEYERISDAKQPGGITFDEIEGW